MVKYMVKVYKVNSQSVYTIFYLKSRSSEILYLIDCVAMGLNRLGYRIVAEQCVWLYIYWYDFLVNKMINVSHGQNISLWYFICKKNINIVFWFFSLHIIPFIYILNHLRMSFISFKSLHYMCKISEEQSWKCRY